MARGYNPALVLHTGPARLISERNREREPSREEDGENRREGGGRREGGRRRGEILRLLTVSTASAAFIRSGDWGRDGQSLSEQTEALRDSVIARQRSQRQEGAASGHVSVSPQALALLPLLHAAVCVVNVAAQVTSFSFGKTGEPQGGVNFWHNCWALRHLDASERM